MLDNPYISSCSKRVGTLSESSSSHRDKFAILLDPDLPGGKGFAIAKLLDAIVDRSGNGADVKELGLNRVDMEAGWERLVGCGNTLRHE